jgi:hypothetical protein
MTDPTEPERVSRGRPAVCAVLSVFAVAWAAPEALAGAWSQPKGQGIAVTTVTVSRASDGFDEFGAVAKTPKFRKEDYELYGEYGLTDRLTALLHTRYTRLHPDPPSERASGLAEGELGLRYGLRSGRRGVFALQASVFVPGGTVLTSGSLDGEIRFNAGSNFRLWRWTGFVDTGFAYRGRMNNFRDELRTDISLGLDLSTSWRMLAQSFTVLTIGPGRTTAFQGQMSKAELSLLYDISSRWALQLGGLATLTGTGVPRERAATAAVWYRF